MLCWTSMARLDSYTTRKKDPLCSIHPHSRRIPDKVDIRLVSYQLTDIVHSIPVGTRTRFISDFSDYRPICMCLPKQERSFQRKTETEHSHTFRDAGDLNELGSEHTRLLESFLISNWHESEEYDNLLLTFPTSIHLPRPS